MDGSVAPGVPLALVALHLGFAVIVLTGLGGAA